MLAAIASLHLEREVPARRFAAHAEDPGHPHAEDPKQSRPVAGDAASPLHHASFAQKYN